MPWVPEIILDLADNMSASDATVLLLLFACAALAIAWPIAVERRWRRFKRRDDEYRRLQNM